MTLKKNGVSGRAANASQQPQKRAPSIQSPTFQHKKHFDVLLFGGSDCDASGDGQCKANICELFGPWVRESDEEGAVAGVGAPADDDGFAFIGDEEEVPPPPMPRNALNNEEYNVDLRSGIYLPGVLHVVHNATESLARSLAHWSEWVSELAQVTRFLSQRWTRHRFLFTCMSRPPYVAHARLYNAFSAQVYEGRWGEALKAVQALLPLCKQP